MGRVVRAYDPKLQREVALKEVLAHQLDAEATTRLVAEARAMAKLSHPNVVAVYDVDESSPDTTVVLVMEYVAGQTLLQWLRQDARRPRQEVVEHFIAAGRGLVAAHAAGLLHRDFKPANVLVSDVVKVTDFGLAKPSGTPPSGVSSADSHSNEERTEAGTIVGTPRYMAPEQHRGETLTAAADQYAFCVALWEAVCGQPPFAGKTMADDKASGPPPWPGTVHRSAIDPPLALLGSSAHSLRSGAQATPRLIVDAIVRGLSPAPDDRWPTMAALLDALDYDPARRRNRWLLGLGGMSVLGLAGAGPDHPNVAALRSNLASELLELGRAAEALPLAEQAWARLQRDDIPKGHRGATAFVLAKALWTVQGPARDRSRAQQLAEDAQQSYRDDGEASEEKARDVQQWLDAHRL